MNAPLVSIIIPSFNYGHFITETLNSVSAQSYQNWECIIVDDGSTDDTAAIVRDFIKAHPGQCFKYISIANSGVSKARNIGVTEAKGIYLQFLDADDILQRDKLKVQVALLEKENAALVYARTRFFYNDGQKKVDKEIYPKGFLANQTRTGYELIKQLIKNNIITISCALVHKELVVKAGMFNANLAHNEDWLLWFNIALLNPRFIFDDSAATATEIRLHEQSGRTSKHKMFLGEVFVREQFNVALKAQFSENEIVALKKYNQDLLALHHIRSLNLKWGLKYTLAAFVKAPFSNFRLLQMACFRLMTRTVKKLSNE